MLHFPFVIKIATFNINKAPNYYSCYQTPHHKFLATQLAYNDFLTPSVNLDWKLGMPQVLVLKSWAQKTNRAHNTGLRV